MSEAGDAAPARRVVKRALAFRTIGEVAEDLELPAHVLRFWESKFPQLKPLKRGGGRRYYRPEDICLLRRIRQCLYHDGYTIRGVQKLLSESGRVAGSGATEPARDAREKPAKTPSDLPPDRRLPPGARAALEELRCDLIEIRELLDRLRDESVARPPKAR